MLYLYLEGEPEDKNFATIMFLLRNAQASEEDESARNPVDELFMEVEAEKGAGHIAVQYWQAYKLAAGKTPNPYLLWQAHG